MKAKQRSAIDQKPSAWIVSSKDKGRKSIKKDNKVYLEDNQNFEIEVFNPLKEPVLAEIKVNGKSISSTGLVLRPGERFYLDCFIDDRKKFVFKTYQVDNTDESNEAISSNGIVEVFFYKEETLLLNNWKDVFVPVIHKHYYPVYPWYTPWNNSPYWYYNGTVTLGPQNITYGTTCNSIMLNGNTTGNFTVDSNSSSFSINNSTATVNLGNLNTCGSYYTNISCSNSIETGRIEKGNVSSQEFIDVDMNFEKYYISSIIYKLLPESTKPIETKDIKSFCSSCGRKLKGSENFCPSCGNKLK